MALTVWDEIHAAATRLADGTAIGHRHASIRNVSLHVYLVRRWYLVYEVDTTPLVIRRVVAARRDLVSLRL